MKNVVASAKEGKGDNQANITKEFTFGIDFKLHKYRLVFAPIGAECL